MITPHLPKNILQRFRWAIVSNMFHREFPFHSDKRRKSVDKVHSLFYRRGSLDPVAVHAFLVSSSKSKLEVRFAVNLNLEAD